MKDGDAAGLGDDMHPLGAQLVGGAVMADVRIGMMADRLIGELLFARRAG